VLFWLRLLVSVGILGYLASLFDWARMTPVLGRLQGAYLWQAPLLMLGSVVIGSARWKALLARFQIPLSLWDGCLLYQVGRFYSIVLPGVIGGDAVRVGMCAARTRKPLLDIFAAAALERGLGVVAVLGMGGLAGFLLARDAPREAGPQATQALVAAAVVALAGLAASVMGLRWATRQRDWGHQRGPWFFPALFRMLHRVGRLPVRTWALTVVLGAVFQACDILATYYLACAIGLQLPVLVFFFVLPWVYLATVVPVSLGGLGVREGAMVLMLSRFGVVASDAILLSFLVYLVRVATALPGRAAQFLKPRVGRAERPAQVAQDAPSG